MNYLFEICMIVKIYKASQTQTMKTIKFDYYLP